MLVCRKNIEPRLVVCNTCLSGPDLICPGVMVNLSQTVSQASRKNQKLIIIIISDRLEPQS